MKKIDVFDRQQVQEMAKQLTIKSRQMKVAEKTIVENTALKLLDNIRETASAYGLGDADFLPSLRYELFKTSNGWSAYVGGDGIEYVYYIEYGTGLKGANGSNAPDMPTWWKHMSGKHSSANGGYWHYEKDGKWYTTYGQAARPFLYHAAELTRMGLESELQIFLKEMVEQ